MNRRALFVGMVVAFSLSGTPHLFAQRSPAQEVYRILGISVEGNTLADPAAIITNCGLKAGDELVIPSDQTAQAVRKLWALKLFEDVRIEVDRKVGEGIYLLIRVKEYPRYERTETIGNDNIDTDDIMKKITFVRGQVVSATDLVRIRREITKLYEEEGYLLADVRVTEEPADSGTSRVVLKVVVDEGEEVQVSHIEFEGNQSFEDGDLRGAMDNTSEKSWWKFWSSAKFDRKKFDEDRKLVVQFYRNNGFRDAGVLSDSIWYTPDKKEMTILLRVYEGPQYKIRAITWDGNTVYPASILNARLGIVPGEVYNAEKLERNLRGNEAQTDVAALYLDNGYLTFDLKPQEERVAEDSIDLKISVLERNQFKIGYVSIKGNTKTHEKVIRRELYTRPGDYFSRAAIMRSVRQLQVLNYFNPEKIKPDYALVDDKTVNLTYEVEEKSSDNINASVGYSGAFGFTGAVGFTITNFALSNPLSGGAGQMLNFEWQFGGYNYRTFTVGFTEPWLYDTPTLLGVSLFDTRQEYYGDIQQTGGSLRIGRRFRWPDDYFRGDWIVSAQRNNVRRDPRGLELEGVSSQVAITQIISRNSLDNPIFPTSGSSVSLSIEMAGGPLLPGTIDFHKWMFQTDWYLPMFGTNRVALYLNTQYGYISGFEDDSRIPSLDLFIMGGTGIGYISTTPLRGYEDQAIGPRNAFGQIIYGKAMTKQAAELRVALALNPIPIYVLGFAEGGNVFESMSKADFFDLKRSAGFGARIQIMPIGLLGFDYGYGFDDVYPLDGKPDGWHFHFVFGKGF